MYPSRYSTGSWNLLLNRQYPQLRVVEQVTDTLAGRSPRDRERHVWSIGQALLPGRLQRFERLPNELQRLSRGGGLRSHFFGVTGSPWPL